VKRGARSGAVALVEQLEAIGVEVVFGIPGVHNLAIFDALRRSKAIRTVVVRHEQAAGYAADGYARATGRLGVLVTTTGPGAANAAAAMGEARASRSPVLHISTQVESRLLAGRGGRFSLHESPAQRELMGAVGVWSATVARADAIPSMVLHAARKSFEGRRGPSFLEIPHDLLAEPISARPEQPRSLATSTPPDEKSIARAVSALDAAKRPAVWAGGGVISSGAAAELAGLAEALDAPVVTTFAGKGSIPRGHPLSVGMPPHQPEVTRLLARSDALLVVGSDLDAMNTQGWRLPLPRPRVSINVVAEDARRNYAADIVVEADARLAVEALTLRLSKRRRGAGARRVSTMRQAAARAVRANKEFAAPFAFVERLEKLVPEDCVVLCDMAVPGYWTAAYYTPAAPRAFAYPMGWGTLGFAFPASIGVAAAGRRAVVVCGDAGFLFAPAELATAFEHRLPILVVVVNDEGYGMLRFDEDERFKERFAVDLPGPDFVALARAFGLQARRVEPDDLDDALKWGLARPGPALIEIRARWAPPLTTSPRWPLKGKPEARP
jgi:thiamine pyrophosphate-dependent acetolactate synthase large subunit-like protein